MDDMLEHITPSNLIARRAHRKSKTGCRACKQRKVKCDENRPVCKNCAIHFVNVEKCDYGHSIPKFFNAPNSPLPKPNPTAKHALRSPRARRDLQPKTEEPELPATISLQPSSTALDPFQTYPPTSVDGVDSLMTHYLTVFVSDSFPFFTRDALISLWWPSIGSDELLFHTTLLLSSLDLEKRSFSKGMDNRWRLAMRECIRLLRERIDGQMTCQDISNETIVSVAILAAIEASTTLHERGDFKSLQLHAEGLQRMIVLRGGLDAMRETHPAAANMVSWILMVLAIDISPQSSPTLGCLDSSAAYLDSPPLFLENQDPQIPGTFSTADLESVGIDFPTLPLLLEIRGLTTRFTRPTDPFPAHDFLSVFDHLCNIMQRLLSLLATPSSVASLPPSYCTSQDLLTPISHATLLALALYILSPLRGMHPDPNLLISTLSLRLRTILASLLPSIISPTTVNPFPSSDLSPSPDHSILLAIHLWLTSIGATSTTPHTPEREWYLGQLVALVGELGIEVGDWEGYRAVLGRTTCCEILCQPRLPSLWAEIEQKREDLAW